MRVIHVYINGMEENKMTNVKDLMNNEELMQYILEDLEDFPEDSPVTYEVWALGYDRFEAITDSELLLAEFSNPDKAVEYAKQITLADIVHKASEENTGIEPTIDLDHISVEVETVVDEVNEVVVEETQVAETVQEEVKKEEVIEPVEEKVPDVIVEEKPNIDVSVYLENIKKLSTMKEEV